MRLTLFLSLVAFTSLRAIATELISVEKFSSDFNMLAAKLAPDGKHLAFVAFHHGDPWLMIMNLETKHIARVDPGIGQRGARMDVRSFHWLSDRRLSFEAGSSSGFSVSAIDCDGKRAVPFSGLDSWRDLNPKVTARTIIHSFEDAKENLLMLERGTRGLNKAMFPNVIKVSTVDGWSETVVENPGDVISWAADRNGVVRLGITRKESRYGAIYRESEKDAWRPLPLFAESLGKVIPLGFDETGQQIYVGATTEDGRYGVYSYDPAAGRLGELVAKHALYDLVQDAGTFLLEAGPRKSPRTKAVVGIRYFTEGPQTIWFEPSLAKIQALVDKALPKTSNSISSYSRDETRFLIISLSDRDPGRYHLLDLSSGKPVLTVVGERMAQFPVDRMASMYPIKYKARDGLEIHGFLTMPMGEKKKALPLVVLPHDYPPSRDTWGFEPLAQFLANRGYAVLQMNYRGSSGYGPEFREKGKMEIGRRIQDDIEDGTRWAIKQGFADPGRISIVGTGFGGFSALFGLANSPGLYRCAVSIEGITDWVELRNEQKENSFLYSSEYIREWLGNPQADDAFLASISPVNLAERMTAPVLVIHGQKYIAMYPWHGSKMIAALQKAGHTPESMQLNDSRQWRGMAEDREKYYQKIEKFLAEHLALPSGAGSAGK